MKPHPMPVVFQPARGTIATHHDSSDVDAKRPSQSVAVSFLGLVKTTYMIVTVIITCILISFTCEVIVNAYTTLPYYDGWIDVITPPTWRSILLAAHNEHRIGLITFLAMLDNYMLGGKGYLLEFGQFVLIIMNIVLFLFALRYSSLKSFNLRVTMGMAIVCALTSAVQFTNLVWSFQVGFVAAYVCGVLSIWIACMSSGERPIFTVLSSCLVAMTGSLGLGGGVLAFPCILGATVLRRMRWRAVILAALICGLVAKVYPVAHTVVNPPPPPLQWARFTLTFLGAPFAAVLSNQFFRWPALPSNWVVLAASLSGAIFFFIYLSFGLRLIVHFRNAPARGSLSSAQDRNTKTRIFLVLVLTFIVFSAVVVGHSRGNLDISEAFSSRYLTPTLIGWTSCLILTGTLCRSRSTSNSLAFFALVGLFFLSLAQADRLLQSRAHSEAMRRAEISIASGVNRDIDLRKLYPDADTIRPLIDVLAFRHRSIFDTAFGQIMGRALPKLLNIGKCSVDNLRLEALAETNESQIISGDLRKRPGLRAFLVVTDAGERVIGVGQLLHRNMVLSRILPDRPFRFEIYALNRHGLVDNYFTHVYLIDGEEICRLNYS